ncbi:MAG: hypothetical protein M3082_21230 [Candidatus Dormibacteraeota bacterium]|nr:hypothetical protein [Candidatus Dormibacteraeota bacterium]
MLAYVFSHRAAPGVEAGLYEESLRRFHAALASASPSGFIASNTFRTGNAYADWYLLENSAALDVLNAAAVSGARTPAHDVIARMAVDGAGKLLSLASGQPSMDAQFEVRFAKPAGVQYVDLYARLQTWTSATGTSLWRRMMVLGPPPEFTLVTQTPPELPSDLNPEVVRREPI